MKSYIGLHFLPYEIKRLTGRVNERVYKRDTTMMWDSGKRKNCDRSIFYRAMH